jgi:IclR family acetate operon transcriptional repressor
MSSSSDTIAIVSHVIGSKGPQKLSDISRTLNIAGSTAYRVLSALKDAEWFIQDPETKRYRPGIGLLELALSLISQLDLKTVAVPFLEGLRNTINEGITLTTRVGLDRIYIYHIQSDHELQQVVSWGKRLPLWAGAAGKAILAYLPPNELQAVVERMKKAPQRVLASGQAIEEEWLGRELAEVRRLGFAISSGERVAGTNSASAPVFDSEERVVGSISVSGPALRYTMKMAVEHGPLIRETADAISLRLGSRLLPRETARAR